MKFARNFALAFVSFLALGLLVKSQGPPVTKGTPVYGYNDITTKTNTQVKTGAGVLHSIVVTSAGTTWSIIVYDNTSCAGTAIIVGSAAAINVSAGTYLFDAGFTKGLCITTGGTTAGDMTVNFL